MTPIEKARAAIKQEQSRKAEFYEGAAYALKLAEAARVGEDESEDERPKTNGDRVRAMSDEELVELYQTPCEHLCLCSRRGNGCTSADCKDGMLAWLRLRVPAWL